MWYQSPSATLFKSVICLFFYIYIYVIKYLKNPYKKKDNVKDKFCLSYDSSKIQDCYLHVACC